MIYCEEFFKIISDKQGGIKTKHRIILLTSKHFQPEKLVKTDMGEQASDLKDMDRLLVLALLSHQSMMVRVRVAMCAL